MFECYSKHYIKTEDSRLNTAPVFYKSCWSSTVLKGGKKYDKITKEWDYRIIIKWI
jgi:hypothetical protein